MDFKILVRRPATPAPAPPEPLGPEARRFLDPLGETSHLRGPFRPVLQVGLQEPIAVGPTAPQPEEVIEQRQVLPGQLPGHAAALAQRVEIDHEELGRIVGGEAHHDVAGMKVLVEQPRIVQPGRHDGHGFGEFLADLRADRLGPLRQMALDELVERRSPRRWPA